MANQNVFFVPATSLTTASVTLQTAGHAAITYADNVFFMGVGGNVSLTRQLEILDGFLWLMTLASAQQDTAEFPRPAAAHLTALATSLIANTSGVKHQQILSANVLSNSDPFASDNTIFFGLTGSGALSVNKGVALGSAGLQNAYQVMKNFSLIGKSIWT